MNDVHETCVEIKDNPNLVHVRGEGWIRLHRTLLCNHKIGRLNDEQFRVYILLLLMADSEHGKLPVRAEMAWHARMPFEHVDRTIDELIDRGLIDISTLGNLFIHGWKRHQYKWDGRTSTERSRKHRARKRKDDDGATLQQQQRNSGATGSKQRRNKNASESLSDSQSSELEERSSPSSQGNVVSLGNSYARVTRGGDA